MIAQLMNIEVNQLGEKLGQNRSQLLLITGPLGTGKSLLLKLVEQKIQSSEQNSAVLYYRLQLAAGLLPQLIELENLVLSLGTHRNKLKTQSSLSDYLRSKLASDQPVITGKPLSVEDSSKLLKSSIEAVLENLEPQKLYLLIDLSDTSDFSNMEKLSR